MQILGSIGSVGGGLALGKEGPLVHTGACIASVLGQVCSTACHGRIIVCVLVCKVWGIRNKGIKYIMDIGNFTPTYWFYMVVTIKNSQFKIWAKYHCWLCLEIRSYAVHALFLGTWQKHSQDTAWSLIAHFPLETLMVALLKLKETRKTSSLVTALQTMHLCK